MVDVTRLFVIRHGETEWNVQRRWQGWHDSPLTANGLRQINALALKLKSYTFDEIFASDLKRTIETANRITAVTGGEVKYDMRLRERNAGDVEGLTIQEIEERFPEHFLKRQNRDSDHAFPNGESFNQRHERVISFFREIVNNNQNKTILIITHGGTLDSLSRYIIKQPLSEQRVFSLPNCALNIVTHSEATWKIERWGDIAHLENM